MATVLGRRTTLGAAALAAVLAVSSPLISRFEGVRLVAYQDPVKIWTACDGHTGADVRAGETFTTAQCQQIFDADQRKVIAAISACTTADVPVKSAAAFTSFAFNVGPGVYCKTFAPLVNHGQLPEACARLSLYVYADHRQLPGLVARRAAERALCEQGAAA